MMTWRLGPARLGRSCRARAACRRRRLRGATVNYPQISEHGLIGDLQTAALVATDGSIDWFCAPRFDSPSIFAALLDSEKGGRFRIHPRAATYETKQMYMPDTAILITRFLTE